jgi:hypothetical protein
MIPGQYILDGHTPIRCTDLLAWGRWLETADDDRIVAQTTYDGARISTVFLGLDHAFVPTEPHVPILFETMIFGGEHDGYQQRYATWAEAEAGHAVAVAFVRADAQRTDVVDAGPPSTEGVD